MYRCVIDKNTKIQGYKLKFIYKIETNQNGGPWYAPDQVNFFITFKKGCLDDDIVNLV